MDPRKSIVENKRGAQLPVPAMPQSLTIRPGTAADEPFIDHCQKLFKGHLGFLYQGTIAKRVQRGEVLVVVDAAKSWVGYIMGTTAYDKNDAVSRIDQIAVVPSLQRGQIGGALLREWISRLPYGVRLICCWCAQDLKENRFWEAQGFVPLAFRAGGQTANRVHIFWQRRCSTGDTSSPFWYPKETTNGAMSAARLILPIPPDANWREVELPRIMPQGAGSAALAPFAGPVTPAALAAAARPKRLALPPSQSATMTPAEYAAKLRARAKHLNPRGPVSPAIAGRQAEAPIVQQQDDKPAKVERPKNLPQHVAAARELRDRWLEQVNAAGIVEGGKYDPTRILAATPTTLGQIASALMAGVVPTQRRLTV